MDSIVLTKKDFVDLKNLVYKTSGINLHEGKLELLKSKIAKRMRLTKKSQSEYLSYLNTNERETIEFIDTVTTNHSFFFRENKSIEHIIEQFQLHPQKDRKQFKLWCAACSTGDEPYTVAAQLKDLGFNFSILATDLSHTVLETAARGIYKSAKLTKVPKPLMHKYFQKGSGKYAGHFKVKKDLTQHIDYKKFNLISDPAPNLEFDAVLCRNVMIYFDSKTSEGVINKLYQTLVPGGFFAIGNAESLMNMKHKYKSIRKVPSLYMK
jgi:chemotaxis protein methyltransferase CheR